MSEDQTVHDAEGLLLRGLDGSNPLGFLAALGTLRVTGIAWPDRRIRMAWSQQAGTWRPVLVAHPLPTRDELAARVARYCRTGGAEMAEGEAQAGVDAAQAFPHFAFDKNTSKIEPERFRQIEGTAVSLSTRDERVFADFIAAFGCAACVDGGFVEDTDLRTMSGSGHQHFLGTMLTLVQDVEAQHIDATLFERWHYQDPLKNHSMRWDPNDDKRHAYQWTDPTHGSERRVGGMWGANRLAIEGLPLLPTMPTDRGLRTTGFVPRSQRPTRWRWPLWTLPTSVDVCRSLLACREMHDATLRSEDLRARGVAAVFESRRIVVGYFRNFTPARAVYVATPWGVTEFGGRKRHRPRAVRELAAAYDGASTRRALDPELLEEIVSRVVEAAQPDRIILFGSAARGEMGPDSDVDLLVVKSGVEHRGRLEECIYMTLFGIRIPVDVVVATPEDVERLEDGVGSVIGPALREGREIYVARTT